VKTPEGWEKQEIDKFLKALGPDIVWHHKTITMGYGASGAPDYVLCLAGGFWGVEVKRPGKKSTPIQNRRMEAIRKAGGHAVAGTAEVVIQVLRYWLAVRGISA